MFGPLCMETAYQTDQPFKTLSVTPAAFSVPIFVALNHVPFLISQPSEFSALMGGNKKQACSEQIGQ